MKLTVSASPHISGKESSRSIMLNVIIALMPALIASGVIFGLRAVMLTGVTVAACVGFEFLYQRLMKQPCTVGDLSAVVTGLLLAFNLPASLPFWMAIVGAFFAIVIVKQLFGGIGFNFVNPAIAARIILAVSFAGAMTNFAPFPKSFSGSDVLASATPLAAYVKGEAIPYIDLFLGTTGGTIGETCAVALLIGFVYLVVTKVISPVVPVTYIGTVVIFTAILGQDIQVHLFAGGLLLGAIFMATDYVTSPYTTKGKIIFGLGLGFITVMIRVFGSMTEGVSYAILLMNLLVPYINRLTRQKPLGGKK